MASAGGTEGRSKSARSGSGTLVYCPECGSRLRSGAQFCGECGKRLPGDSRRFSRPGSTSAPRRPVGSPEARVGEVIGGFKLERLIARGGMGVVYLARQLKLNRPVALKLIAPEYANDRAFRERFKREALLAATLESPHIVPVYDADVADGELYLAMRYIEGADLRSLIAAHGALAPGRAARIANHVGAALDAAHKRGLVHRDVKPANILLAWTGSEETAYLSDFGLLKRLGESGATQTGRWVGTVDYAAPEQIEGRRVDARTDIYALGCVLYKALTGEVPFPRDSDTAVMWAHVHHPPPDPRTIRANLPAPFAGVLMRALAKDPEKRFRSAGDFGRAAMAAAAGRLHRGGGRSVAQGAASPTRVAPPSRHESPPHPRRQVEAQPRRPNTKRSRLRGNWPTIILALLAAVLAAAAAVAVVLLSHGISAATRAARADIRTAQRVGALTDRMNGLSQQLNSTSDATRQREIAMQLSEERDSARELQAQAQNSAEDRSLDARILAADQQTARLAQLDYQLAQEGQKSIDNPGDTVKVVNISDAAKTQQKKFGQSWGGARYALPNDRTTRSDYSKIPGVAPVPPPQSAPNPAPTTHPQTSPASSAQPSGGSGIVTTKGAVGDLNFGISKGQDVRQFAGRPDATAVGTFGVTPKHFRALGYGCSSNKSDQAMALSFSGDTAPYCQTVYYLDNSDSLLQAFWTSSPNFRTLHGTKPGASLTDAEQNEGTSVQAGCRKGITLGSFQSDPATLFIDVPHNTVNDLEVEATGQSALGLEAC